MNKQGWSTRGRAAGGALLAAVLAACGGTDGASTAVSGTAMAGPFLAGTVCAYKIADGQRGTQIGCSAIDPATSGWKIDLAGTTGDVLLEIGGGARYDDEADSTDNTRGTALPDGAIRTLVSVKDGTVTSALTPLTELALRMALAANGGRFSPTVLAEQAQALRTRLNLPAGVDLLATQPVVSPTDGTQRSYREALRALSQLQTSAGYQGNLAAHLASLVQSLPTSQFTAELKRGLSADCSVGTDGVLSCKASVPAAGGTTTGGTTGTAPGTLTCNTKAFQAGAKVSVPTADQLKAFARTYTGSAGSYDANFNFVATGKAELVFAADGGVAYNGTGATPSSLCFEANDIYGDMLYLAFASGAHVDLFKDGVFSGEAPTDAKVSIKSDKDPQPVKQVVTASPVTLPNGSVVDSTTATITQLGMPNIPGGKITKFSTSGGALIEVYDYVDTLNVSAGAPGLSITLATTFNACALTPAKESADNPSCSSLGITFDRAGGTITLAGTLMKKVVFTCTGACTLSGTLRFPAY